MPRRASLASLLALGVVGCTSHVSARQTDLRALADRGRERSDQVALKSGRVVPGAVAPDLVHVELRYQRGTVAVPLERVDTITYARPIGAGKGAALGGLVGMVAGAGIGYMSMRCDSEYLLGEVLCDGGEIYGAAVGALIGLGVGALSGGLIGASAGSQVVEF